MSNGNLHTHGPLPMLLAGGAAGHHKGDRHLSFEVNTPMANLLLNVAEMLDVPTEKFGDSTGRLTGL